MNMISVCLQNTDLCVALFADDIRLEQHNICPTFLDWPCVHRRSHISDRDKSDQ